MKVCDKCGDKVYGTVVVRESEIDLCHEHYQIIVDYLMKPEVREIRETTKPVELAS